MNKKCPNVECLTTSGYDLPVFKLKIKIRKFLISLCLLFAACMFAGAQQSFTLVDDHATTGPMQGVRVNVLANDIITCAVPDLTIVSTLDPVTQGTATVESDGFISFMPALGCRGVTVTIQYKVVCNEIELTANLTIDVTLYNNPANVIDEDLECFDVMPSNIEFGIHLKYHTDNRTNDNWVDAYQSPMVGDLDGDGKPEIVIIGATGSTRSSNGMRAGFIAVYNGQTGTRLIKYTFASGVQIHSDWHTAPTTIALADLDGDGKGEIIACNVNTGLVVAFKATLVNAESYVAGNTLSEMWRGQIGSTDVNFKSPVTASNDAYRQVMPYVADLNGDGIPEVIVYNKIFNGATGKLLMAWQDAAPTLKYSNYTATTGLFVTANFTSNNPLDATQSDIIKNHAMVGRRHAAVNSYNNRYVGAPAIVDIDGDGQQEIITGNRIHKFQFNSLSDHTQNTYTTIEGPASASVPEGGSSNATYYLSDGFTRVADIDGDGELDIIVATHGNDSDYSHYKVVVYVWSLDDLTSVKACVSFGAIAYYGNFSVPFIGDINGKIDGPNNTKLPEICLVSGATWLDRRVSGGSSAAGGRTGVKFHPLSDEKLRQGTAAATGTAAGWDNNQLSNTNRRFNRTIAQMPSGSVGHIIGLTWDDNATTIEDKLKLSWGMEHSDQSASTGITLFDFDNNNTADLCYRDESSLRVISPARAGNDYVTISETATTPNSAVMFRFTENQGTGTGLEYPVIADVNMDGSADIIVGNAGSNSYATGWVDVFEYVGTKWAPCPPVWNQGMYDPTQVREDLKINARPISMLTEFVKNNETIRPYNGSWMQVPITRNNQDFVSIVRHPDAVLQDVRVTVVSAAQTNVILQVFNAGTASIGANTPVAFYDGGTDGKPIGSSTLIMVRDLGVDIFPNEQRVTAAFSLSGNYNDHLIWVRVMDSGTAFPASGFEDCDLTNNAFGGSHCQNLNYTVQASSTVLCGDNGVISLKAVSSAAPQYTPTYQWYKNEMVITDATGQIYFATEPGAYKCYVTEGPVCRGYSTIVTITQNNGSQINIPNLVMSPSDGALCVNGNILLSVNNYASYTGAQYIWVKDGVPFDTTSLHYIRIPHAGIQSGHEDGSYTVFVKTGSCSVLSEADSIHISSAQTVAPIISKTPSDAVICGDNGSVLLQVTNASALTGSTFQWYRDGIDIPQATGSYYFATEAGVYTVLSESTNGCSAFSTGISVTKQAGNVTQPVISREPSSGLLCDGGSVLLNVSSPVSGYTYRWYKTGVTASISEGTYVYVTEAGTYYVMAIDNACTSNSNEITISASGISLGKPEIESLSGSINICTGGSVLLRLKTSISGVTSYQWYLDGAAITGATGTSYQATAGGKYSLKVSNSECYSYSDELTLTPGGGSISAAVINSLTGSYNICGSDGEIILQLTTSYSGSPVYRWIQTISGTSTVIPNSNSPLLRVSEAGQYRIEVSLGGCVSVSQPVTVSKDGSSGTISKPDLRSIPSSAEYCAGGVVQLYVNNSSTYSNPVYRWFRGNVPLPSTTVPYINVSTAGDYFVSVSSGNCFSGSDTISVSTASGNISAPVVEMLPANGQICVNGGVLLRVTNTSSYSGASYQWYKDSTAINGATENMYMADSPGSYYVRIVTGNGSGCTVISALKQVQQSSSSINEVLIEMIPSDGRIMGDNGSVSVGVVNSSDYTGFTYYWVNTSANNMIIASGVNLNYQEITAEGDYRIFIDNGYCSVWSEIFSIRRETGCSLEPPVVSITPDISGGSYYLCLPNGSVVLRVTNTSDYVSPVYSLIKNNLTFVITDSPSPTMIITPSMGAGLYQISVSDQGCNIRTANYDVKTSTSSSVKPVISSNPSTAILCGTGSSIVLTLTNSSSFTGSIQWLKDNSSIPGATGTAFIASTPGSYRVQISETTCAYLSDPITISSGSGSVTKPVLAQYPSIMDICTGGSIRLSVSNHQSSSSPTYYWYHDGAMVQSGPTPYYYATQPGTYYVHAVNGNSCSSTSDPKVLQSGSTTISVPVISSLPSSPVICGDNGTVQLSLTIDYGTGASYQWYRNGSEITGSTGKTLSTGDEGSYHVEVSAGSCMAVSQPVTVTKNVGSSIALPVVTKEPPEIIGASPATLIFSNISVYSTPLTYYWYNSDKTVLLSSNTPTYNVSSAGSYYLLVVSGGCARWSNEITVSVVNCTVSVPLITSQPTYMEICGVNGRVLLQVSNRDTYTNAKWQWYKGSETIPGANSPTLEISGSGGTYKVKITDSVSNCYNYSANQVITYNPGGSIAQPQISAVPNTTELCGTQGGIILRFSNPSSYGNPQYYWLRNNIEIPGATGQVYEVTIPDTYRLMVVDGGCVSLSEEKVITRTSGMIQRPVLSKLPSSNSICINGYIRISITNASSYNSPVYTWYNGSNIVQSSNSPVYLATVAGEYYVQAVEGLCSSVSLHETLTMGGSSIDKPLLTVYPEGAGSKVICGANGVVVLKLSTSYPAGTTYQWYKNEVSIPESGGGTGTIYTATDAGSYYVEVISGGCASKSDAVSVISNPGNPIAKPDVTVYPPDGRIVANQSAVLTLNNSGNFSSPTYYWFRGDMNRFSTTASIYATGTTTLTTNVTGDYRLLVLSGSCASWSDLILITSDVCENPTPVIEAVNGITNICGNDGTVLLRVANKSAYAAPTYQWVKDNSPIPGAIGATLELGSGDEGTYQVSVTDGCMTTSTGLLIIAASGPSTATPAVSKTPSGGIICGTNGGSVLLSFTNRSAFANTVTYEWYKDNYPVVIGQTTTGLTYPATEAGKYRIVLMSGGCMYLSDEVEVTLNPSGSFAKPVLTTIPADVFEICDGGSIRLDVLNRSIYPSTATFTWYRDDSTVPVGSGDYYLAMAAGAYFVQVTDGACSGISDKKILSISNTQISTPLISAFPSSLNICGDGSVVVLQLSNSNQFTGASCQWYKDGSIITGATGYTHSATQSGEYYLQITVGSCSVSSTIVNISKTAGSTTLPAPNITMFPVDGEIPDGGYVRLSFNNKTAYSGSATWYWYRGENEIVNQGADYYDAYQAGLYRLLIIDGTGCARWSEWFDITTGCSTTKPTVIKEPASASYVCTPNGSILLKVNNISAYNDPHFQWYDGTTSLTGATSSVYEVQASGSYLVRVTDGGCKNYSDPVGITANPSGLGKPQIVREPSTGDICGANGSVILRFTNSEQFTSYYHMWYRNNEAITSNSTGLIYEATESGAYRIVVWDAGCMAMSEEITVTAGGGTITKPVLTKLPGSGYICQNGSVRFTVSNSNLYTGAQYIWYRGDTRVAETSQPEYVATAAGTYFVHVITSGGCSSTSARETLTSGGSIAVPVLNTYPSPASICISNGIAVLRLMNVSSYQDAVYQWYKNDVAITGATLPVLQTNQAGSYYLEITTPDCSAVTQVTVVTIESPCVMTPPVISSTPGDAKIVGDNPVLLSLTNQIYTPSAKYYWLLDNGTIVHEDSEDWISTVTEGTYRLLVVDNGHAAVSNEITVTESTCILTTLPQLSVLPSSLNICGDNGGVYMSLLNSSAYSSAATFQWYRYINATAVTIPGATQPYYTATQAGQYKLRVIDLQGIEYCVGDSPVYTVTKTAGSGIEIPDLRMTPSSGTLCANGSIILYVFNRGAYDTYTTVYRWYKNGLLISGATSYTYELTDTDQTETEAEYKVQVLEGSCGILSDALTVRRSSNTALKPIIDASGGEVCGQNGSVLLKCTNIDAFGTGMKYYQWFYSSNGDNYGLQSGATSSTYEATLGGYYRLQIVSGTCGSMSDPITLSGSGNEIPKPITATLPDNGQICGPDGSVYIYVANTSLYANPVYQWYRNNIEIPGATASGYEVTGNVNNGNYRVNITDGACSALSVNRNISISSNTATSPVITSVPSGITDLCGLNGVLVLGLDNINSFTNPAYVWYKDGSPITTGAYQNVYIAETPGTYRLQVLEGVCSSFSNAITLLQGSSSITKPVIVSESGTPVICGSASGVMLTLTTEYTGNVSYQWFKGDTLQTGATSRNYYATVTGNYKILVTVDACSSQSDFMEVTFDAGGTITKPELKSQGDIDELCLGTSSVLLSVDNADSYTASATYVWYKDGSKVQDGASSTYIASETGFYHVYVYETDGCSSSSDTLEIKQGTTAGISQPVIASESGTPIICGSASGVMLTLTTDYTGSNISYQWFDGITDITGATSRHYYTTKAGDYKVLVTVDGCSAESNVITVSIDNGGTIPKPELKSQGDITVLCSETSSVLLRVDNTADYTSATYVWYRNDSVKQNGTSSTYIAAEAGFYHVYVYTVDGCGAGSDTLEVIQLSGTGLETPVIESQSGSTVICGAESSVQLRVVTEYTGTNVSYQWFRTNGETLITGATSRHYTATEPDTYTVLVTVDNCSSEQSNVITVSIDNGGTIPKPELKSQGDIDELCLGTSSVLLSVDNADSYTSSATYVWYRNDTEVQDGPSSTYIASETGFYHVYVYQTDGCSSSSDTLEIKQGTTAGISQPVIASESGTPVICGATSGVMLTLTTDYTGSNISYQWFDSITDITGATSSHYYTTKAGKYKVLVTVDGCSAESNVITVSIDNGGTMTKPELKSQGDIDELCLGTSSVLLSVDNADSYTSSATYVWYRNDSEVQNGTSSTYIASETGFYHVYVYETDGCSSSSDTLEIKQGTTAGISQPVIVSESGTPVICGAASGVMLTLTTDYTGSNISYQWFDSITDITDATSSHYYTTKAGDYKVLVTVDGCSAESNVITVSIDNGGTMTKPELKSQGDIDELCLGTSSVLLSVDNADSYTASATYIWYRNDSEVQNGTSSTYIASDTGFYHVYVYETDGCSSGSDTLEIKQGTTEGIDPQPVIASESGTPVICGTESGVMLTLTTDYTGNVSYKWFNVEDGLNVEIDGATSRHYYTTKAGEYMILVTIDGCSAESNVITVTFNSVGTIPKPELKSQGDITVLCSETSSVLLRVDNTADYTSATYVWYRNGTEVQNGASSTYIASDTGFYHVYVYTVDGCGAGSDTLEVIQLSGTGLETPVIESQSGSTVICGAESGIMLTLTTDYTGSNISYQWFDGITDIPGATSRNYYTTKAGDYKILVTVDGCSSEQSNVISVSIDNGGTIPKPELKSQGDIDELCLGTSSVLLSVDNADSYTSSATYVWYRNDTEVQDGPSSTYIASDTGFYHVYVYETDGCSSSSDTLEIKQGTTAGISQPVIVSESGTPVICGAESGVMLTLTTDYTGSNISYQWFDSITDITGATSSHYYTTKAGEYKVLVTVDGCSAESNVITVSIDNGGTIPKLELKSQGDIDELCLGTSSVLLSVDNADSYTASATYVWYRNDSEVQNGTSSTYIASETGFYHVYVYETDGCSSSSDTLEIKQGTTAGISQPVIVSESGTPVICGATSGVMLTLTTDYTGSNISYQWFDSITDITGATSSHYYTTKAGEYKVLVTVDGCSAESNVITVSIDNGGTMTKPELKSQGDIDELCLGTSSVLLSVDNADAYTASATYVWYRNDSEVQNGTSSTYIASDTGFYHVYVYETDGCSSSSDTLEIKQGTTEGIDPQPVITSESGTPVICGTESGVMLTLTTDYTGNVSYKWFNVEDGLNVEIDGATSRHYYTTKAGEYMILVTIDGCSAESNVITVTFNSGGTIPKPELKSEGDLTAICDITGSVLLYVNNSSAYTSATYVWYLNDSAVQTGGSNMHIADEPGFYYVYVYEDGGCSSSSDTLEITRGPDTGINKPVIESESGSTEICGDNSAVRLILTTSYTETNLTYQWFRNDSTIIGANQAYYYATTNGDYKILVASDGCSAQSDVIAVTYNSSGNMPSIDLRSTDASNILCSGSSLTLYVNNSSDYASDATYVWYDEADEKSRGVNMYEYTAVSSGNYSVMIFTPDGCLTTSADTIEISEVDSLIIDSIYSSLGTQLIYSESTDLTVIGVEGGIAPYIYTWYMKSESATVWTEVYNGINNTLSTGSLIETTCYRVEVQSGNPLLTCNIATDSICIEVSQVELTLEFLDDIYSICNSTTDSVGIKITNSKPGFATGVLIEFKTEGSLSPIANVLIDSIAGDSDTTILIYLPENTGANVQLGLIKAEIISCDQNDANPLTHYGNWRDARNWEGEPQEADEDLLNLTVYPDLRLLSPLTDEICSGETFTYIPESNIQGTVFTWERSMDAYFEHSSGVGAISEILENNWDESIAARYIFTLGADFCPSSLTDTITVVVAPRPTLTLTSNLPSDGVVTLGSPIIIVSHTTSNIPVQYGYSLSMAAPLIYTYDPEYRIYDFNDGELNTVNVTAVNDYGCSSTEATTFEATYNLPNVITPKALTNDRLLPPAVSGDGQEVRYDIQVFNRLGSELYHGTDGWDGTYKGTFVASGTYFYVLKYTQPNGKVLTLKRSVFVKY